MAEEQSGLYVPEALEEQIQVRLPVKSVVRFKSVCKRWHSLFGSKAFEEFYFGLHDKEAFIPTSKDLRLICPELHRRRRRSKRRVKSAIGPLSNGIYALPSFLWAHDNYLYPRVRPHTLQIALFNPATRRVKLAASFPDEYLHLLSAIEPFFCNVFCGIDDDYRVVVLIDHEPDPIGQQLLHCFLVFMYTWRTGHWEKLVDYDPSWRGTHVFKNTLWVVHDMMACSKKLFNGCWHWMTIEKGEEGFGQFGVLSFDFERKSLELISGPPGEITLCADVFVLQDHLAGILLDSRDCRLEIWRKTKTTWTNVYKVNISQSFVDYEAILHGVYYQVVEEEEPASIKIKRLVFIERKKRLTCYEQGHMMEEFIDISNPKISLRVGGISKFTPTFEPLPL